MNRVLTLTLPAVLMFGRGASIAPAEECTGCAGEDGETDMAWNECGFVGIGVAIKDGDCLEPECVAVPCEAVFV